MGYTFVFLLVVFEEKKYLESYHLKSGYSGINLLSSNPLHTLGSVSELERMNAEESGSD